MTKRTGIPVTLTIDNSAGVAQNISNDVTSINASTPRGLQDITGLDRSAFERLGLLADGKLSISGVFNPLLSHLVFRDVHTSAVTRTVVIVYPGPATLTMEMLFSDYAITRAQSGELTWSAEGELANGVAPAWS
ncbi:MAG TPA: hypothetical protein VLM76_11670 [Patescibacteria group bacterium]|nr:hypothetical protein [Patescibacteria group bacterium]